MHLVKKFVLAIIPCMSLVASVHSAEQVEGWALSEQPIVIKGGTLIDVRTGKFLEDAFVLIRGDRIEEISSGNGEAPNEAVVLDATGKYLLPGLIDAHVHYKGWAAPLYLNHGVTTALSLGDTYDWIRVQKEGIKRGEISGPRLFFSTDNLDKTPEGGIDSKIKKELVFFDHQRYLDNADDARFAIRKYVDEGVSAVKVYGGLSKKELKPIVSEAKKAGIPVVGHFRDVYIAAEMGGHGIEHTTPVARVLVDENAKREAMPTVRSGLDIPDEAFMDLDRLPEVVEFMVEHGLYLNPTIRMSWQSASQLRELGFHFEDFDLTFNNWKLRFIPVEWRIANLKEYQEHDIWNWRDLSQHERDLYEQGYRNMQKLIKAFTVAGGKLYAGTDSANMATPGLSLHQEMELFIAAGISPLTALQAATINPAELMQMSERLGSLEVGKVGDVVIVDANPLEDIRNTRKISHVVSRGKVLDGTYDADFKNPVPRVTAFGSSHFFPSPRLRILSPRKFDRGSEQALITVHGSGFIPYSSVQWNGNKLRTEFVSQYELVATVPGEMLENIGTYSVSVANPDFGYGSAEARGAEDIVHLGWMKSMRDEISNDLKVMVAW